MCIYRSIKFITKIAEICLRTEKFVLFWWSNWWCVHVIFIEMPMPCKWMSHCFSPKHTILCVMFSFYFRLNGINGLEKFFWFEFVFGCHLVSFYYYFLVNCCCCCSLNAWNLSLDIYECVCECVDIFGFPEAASHIRWCIHWQVNTRMSTSLSVRIQQII